jgi:ATP-dependent helicase HrpA
VLATNVAETSLTVPGIRFVVDTGVARISRYSTRLKVQRLPIEPISRASADQRKGRCGRVADGICVRLYSEEDFDARPEFTDPEVLRTNLASVILQMASLGLGEVEAFPFLEPPDRRQVRDGVALLHELRALDPSAAQPLTPLGRKLAWLPIDPRLGRMVLEADGVGCVREVIVIAAALSIQDPRERPAEQRAQADQLHARFTDKASDFLTYINLWDYVRSLGDELSRSQLRKRCTALRAALAPGHEGRRHTRVHRRARGQVRHLPRLRARAARAVVGNGGRAGRDVAAMGQDGSGGRRQAGRAPR